MGAEAHKQKLRTNNHFKTSEDVTPLTYENVANDVGGLPGPDKVDTSCTRALKIQHDATTVIACNPIQIVQSDGMSSVRTKLSAGGLAEI